jgi:hypothetical protein
MHLFGTSAADTTTSQGAWTEETIFVVVIAMFLQAKNQT